MAKAVSWKRYVLTLWLFIGLVIILGLLQAGDIGNYVVVSASMEPTLKVDERVFTLKVNRYVPNRGDVVALEDPQHEGELLAKRVIGLPGDEIQIENGELRVNGLPPDEPYLDETNRKYDLPNKYKLVPDGHIFVLGDNRNRSHDSWQFGPVPIDSVKSKLRWVYSPLGSMRSIK